MAGIVDSREKLCVCGQQFSSERKLFDHAKSCLGKFRTRAFCGDESSRSPRTLVRHRVSCVICGSVRDGVDALTALVNDDSIPPVDLSDDFDVLPPAVETEEFSLSKRSMWLISRVVGSDVCQHCLLQ